MGFKNGDALGGDPSPQEQAIIADSVKTMPYIGTLDEYLMSLDGGIIRSGKVIPVIETRTTLAAHLRRDLEALGLQRRVKPTSINDLLNGHDESQQEGDTGQ